MRPPRERSEKICTKRIFTKKTITRKTRKIYVKGIKKEKERVSSMLYKRQTKEHKGIIKSDKGSNRKKNEIKKVITKESKMAKL